MKDLLEDHDDLRNVMLQSLDTVDKVLDEQLKKSSGSSGGHGSGYEAYYSDGASGSS